MWDSFGGLLQELIVRGKNQVKYSFFYFASFFDAMMDNFFFLSHPTPAALASFSHIKK